MFEEEEIDEDADKHPEFFQMESFNYRNFKYFSYNRAAFEGGTRSEKEMLVHRPEVKIEEKGNKVTLTFSKHPHKKSHYWSWFEIRDANNNEVYVDSDYPQDDQETYEKVIYPENPFAKRIRIRCFCQVHGQFIEYVDLPSYKVKTIIDID
jgi:desulfoferrodoxin (superoxide reductase-like protein)